MLSPVSQAYVYVVAVPTPPETISVIDPLFQPSQLTLVTENACVIESGS